VGWVSIDAKHSLEDVIMLVAEFKRLYGDRVAAPGVGFNKLRCTLRMSSLSTSWACCESGSGGGYALGSGDSIANYVRIENYLEMLRLGVRCSRYLPRLK